MNSIRTLLAITALSLTAVCSISLAADADYKALVTYDFGQSRTCVANIEDEMRLAATPEARKAIEAKLLDVLKAPNATFAGKQTVCRLLQRVGSEACVPPVAALLTDEKLSHAARLCLQGMEYPQAGEALRDALGKVGGALKVGVIGSIGARHDAKAVGALATFAGDSDAGIAKAAITALGQIGGSDAVKALGGLKVSDANKDAWADAYLTAADSLVSAGKAAEAAAVYTQMFAEGNPAMIRVAALQGLVAADKGKALSVVLSALKDKDAAVQAAAGAVLNRLGGAETAKAIATALPTVSPSMQVVLLANLSQIGDKAGLAAAIDAISSDDTAVRQAAIAAVGKMGDETAVPALLAAVAKGADESKAVEASLRALRGEKVNAALADQMAKGTPAVACMLLGALADRQAVECFDAVAKLTSSADRTVRTEASRALGLLATAKEIPAMVSMLVKASTAGERSGMEKAIVSAGLRLGADSAVEPLNAAMGSAPAEVKASLLRTMGKLGGEKALAAIRAALKDSDEKLKDAAVRAMVEWPDAAAAADLLEIAKNSGETPVHQILALQGYLRIASLPAVAEDPKTALAMFKQAEPLAKRPEEKRLLLGGLSGINNIEALKMVAVSLDDPAVNAEASVAAVTLGKALYGGKKKEVIEVMKKVQATCKDKNVVKEAKSIEQGTFKKK